MEEQAEVDDDPLLGQSVGNYVVRSKLGEGGMGTVYLAEHPLIGKRVALKVLHPELSSRKDVVERFFHEAKAVNDIQHPNIVDIVDYGKVQGAHPSDTMVYFIMEFLDGQSLTDVVKTEAPIPVPRALHLALQIADCLAASHRAGIVHRDLKPDNIILVAKRHETDFVKVLDFGIAKLTGDGHKSRKTRTGIVMGTPAYMSPEQCEGRGLIDHRTDIYALGILLYEMLTGRVPFQGEGYGEVLVQHLTQPPEPPSSITQGIPPHLEVVVLKALAKSRDHRFPSMHEFIRALMDPYSYVESRGGLAGFLDAPLVDSGGPPPRVYQRAGSVLTPPPTLGTPAPVYTPAPHTGMAHTPPPGAMNTPYPGYPTPPPGAVPTPIGVQPSQAYGHAAPTQWPQPPKQNRTALFAVLGLLVIGGGVATAVVLSGGGDETAEAEPAASGESGASGASGESGESAAAATPADDVAAKVDPPPEQVKDPVDDLAEPKTYELSFETDPAGATIYIGDEVVGTTNSALRVPAGEKEIVVRLVLDGYLEAKRTFKPTRDKTFSVDLKRDKAQSRRERRKKQRERKKTAARTDTKSKKKTGSSSTLRPPIEVKKKKKTYDSTGVLRPRM